MRVLQVVSYASVDGAFGGPLAVAMNQSRELARLGYSVEMWAGTDGKSEITIDGVAFHSFRVFRVGPTFSGLVSPTLWRELRRAARGFDVVHVHLGRDPISMLSAWIAMSAGSSVVVQTHGMIPIDRRVHARIWDAILTRRVLRASKVLTLSLAEEEDLTAVAGASISGTRVFNSVPLAIANETKKAHSRANVVFLARLHPRKRVLAFAAAAALVTEMGHDVAFRVYGPDEGDLMPLLEFIESNPQVRLSYEGVLAPGDSASVLANASAFVLPSVGEVFPMTVLESLAAGAPVIMTRDCALAPLLRDTGAALVTDGTPYELAEAIASILRVPNRAEGLRQAGQSILQDQLSMSALGETLDRVYRESASSAQGQPKP